MPSRRKPVETPCESFERLRQCFDSIKEKHSDPWCWHEYLNAEPELTKPQEDADDPEGAHLSPKPRSNVDRLKSHLLSTVGELQRAAAAADMCYYHMSTTPEQMKECCIILGTSGDVDEEMLASGDASPQKLLAMMQEKLVMAKHEIAVINQQMENMKERLSDTIVERDTYWRRWQKERMWAEESVLRLNDLNENWNREMDVKRINQEKYNLLDNRFVRCDRLMKFQSREVMRKTFVANKKENLFYAFVGFVYVLQEQKLERERREQEMRREAVEFSLKNEVRFLIGEIDRRQEAVQIMAVQTGRLKHDRKSLAQRVLWKMRKYTELEYCLWMWELWQGVRASRAMIYEKQLVFEVAARKAATQQLNLATKQVPLVIKRMDIMKREFCEEKAAADLKVRTLSINYAKVITNMWEQMFNHRKVEYFSLQRIHTLDVEQKDERIAVLERDIAEDKHIQALRGMVVDLESRLRKALDRRKARGLVVPPGKGVKCVMCSREIIHRNWKDTPKVPEYSPTQATSPTMTKSNSDAALSQGAKNWRMGLGAKYADQPAFAAVWR